MKNYILLYGDKKPEDNICLTNMFEKSKPIHLGWTDFDYNHNMNLIQEEIKNGVEQIIFAGLEIGWDRMIEAIKKDYPNVIIKVICTTSDSLLYYEYERNNFFRLLELEKEKKVDGIAFLRKGQYETYKALGYHCYLLKENYCLKKKEEFKQKTENVKDKKINLGIYPLNYTWDKNIFNQLCVGKMLDNSKINYNLLDPRMKEFLDTMNIESQESKIQNIEAQEIIKEIVKNDVCISCSFTEYMHPIFFLSMEMEVPCLIGNNSDLFEEDSVLKSYVVTEAEDNAIINAEKIKKILENKSEVLEQYKIWKEKYNQEAKSNLEEFLEK